MADANPRLNELLGKRMSEIYDAILWEKPFIAIMTISGLVEQVLNELLRQTCKSKQFKSGRPNLSTTIAVLYEKDVISEDLYRVLQWLRKLRNTVAHGNLFYEPTKQDLNNCPLKTPAATRDLRTLCISLLSFLLSANKDRLEKFLWPETSETDVQGKEPEPLAAAQ